MKWKNEEYNSHYIVSPPYPGTGLSSELPAGANIRTSFNSVPSIAPGGTFSCRFTEPGGFHYADGYEAEIKRAVIVEDR